MALSAQQTSIVQLVTTMFNAAPGSAILAELDALVTAGRSLDDLASDLALTGVFTDMYPATMTDNAFATAFINNLVGSTLTDAIKLVAVQYTEGQIAGGLSREATMKAVSDALIAIDNTDANFGVASATLENKIAAAANFSETQSGDLAALQGAISAVTDDVTTIPAVVVVAVEGKTFTLTTAADALTPNSADPLTATTANDDTIIATNLTLGAADVLNGGAGTDTLFYASTGTGPIAESGFQTTNIEKILVTSDATAGTTFDVTDVSGATDLTNSNSSQNLTLTGLANALTVGMKNVSGGNTTVQYKDNVLTGTADAQAITLEGNKDNTDSAASVLSIGNSTSVGTAGLETLNITTTGSSSLLTDIVTGAATINVAGDQDLSVGLTLDGATKIDANTFTGKLSVKADSGVLDVAVTGGTNDDRADFSNGWDKDDSFDGGAGTDTLGLNYAGATSIVSTNSGTATNVEVLDVTTVANANGTIDMDNFTGISKVILNAGINTGVTATIDDAVTGLEVELDVDSATTGSLVVDLKTDGAADVVTLTLDEVGAADGITSLDAADAETLNISADDDTTVTGTGVLTIGSLTATDATALNLSGNADITITNTVDPTTAVLATIDGSTATGKLNISGTNTAAAGATITLGAGDDTFNVATSSGADTITLGAGKDKIVYTAAAQSSGLKTDTITDFKQGEDVLDASAWTNTSSLFLGNATDSTAAETALTGVVGQAVFIQSEGVVVVDVDGDGDIGSADLRVKLTGVTELTAADLGLGTGNAIDLTNAAAVVTATLKTNATAVSTNENDTVTASTTDLVGSAVNGLLGTDTLTVSGTAAAAESAVITATNAASIETVTIDATVEDVNVATGLLASDGGAVTKLNGVAGTLQSLTVGTTSNLVTTAITNIESLNQTGNVTMTLAQHNAFSAINAAGGADSTTLTTAGTLTANTAIETYTLANGVNNVTLSNAAQNVTGGTGVDTVNAGALALTGTINLAGATDVLNVTTGSNISGATLTVDTLGMVGSVTMTNAQHNAFGTITAAGGSDTIVLTGTAGVHVTGNAAVESYSVNSAAGAYNFTVGSLTQNVTESGTNATIILGTAGSYTGTFGSVELLSLTANTNITAATGITGNITATNIANGTSQTMTSAQYAAIENLADNDGSVVTGLAGTETITITTSGAVDALFDGGNNATVENYVLTGTGADTFNIDETADVDLVDAVRGNISVNLSGGGADTINIDNAVINTGVNSAVTVTNFTADDVLNIDIAGVSHSAGFQSLAAADTAVTVGANSVLEINSAVATVVDATLTANDGAIETILLSAIGTMAAGADANYTAVLYGNGNAYVYNFDHVQAGGGVAGSADDAADITTIELIGTLNGVAVDSLTSVNFS